MTAEVFVKNVETKEGSTERFWREQGVTPIPLEPCKEGEEGFSWSEFINGLGRRIQRKEDNRHS